MIKSCESGRATVTYHSFNKAYLTVSEPPLLRDCININQFIDNPLQISYPNHTQAVERAVKLTTGSRNQIRAHKRQMGKALCKVKNTGLASTYM